MAAARGHALCGAPLLLRPILRLIDPLARHYHAGDGSGRPTTCWSIGQLA